MKRNTISMLLAILLVIPIAPVLYALLGGGLVGSVACLLLGVVTAACMIRAVNGTVEVYNWIKHRNVHIEEPKPMPVPQHTAYEIDWTKITKDDRL